MASILNDTMIAAKDVMDQAKEGAGHAVDTAKAGTEQAVASTRSAVFDGVKAVSSLISTLKSLDGDDALGFVGLARKRSALFSAAIFGAGVVVGAGMGMILAPMTGAQLREMILGQLRKATDDAKANVKEAEQKVEDLAGKAGQAVKDAEQKMEDKVVAGAEAVKDKVTAGAEAVKDVVMHQVGALADVAEDVVDDTKQKTSSNGQGAPKAKPNQVSGSQSRHS